MTEAAQWRTDVGSVWAEEWARTDRSFAGVSAALDAAILAAAPETGEVLDIGCGAGGTSIALAKARPTLAVTGVDLSPDLVAVAQERGAALLNLRFQVADAADPPPPVLGTAHALAVSRHGVMFFAHPVAAFTAIRTLLAPGAPLVFSCFQAPARNPWASDVVEAITGEPLGASGDMPGPFAFADPDHVAAVLAEAGWSDASARDLDYTYIAGEGPDPVADAAEFLGRIGPGGRAMATLPEAERPAAHERLRALLERHVTGDTVAFPAAAWIWTARA
jgi:SAM-dependent methyltransferase